MDSLTIALMSGGAQAREWLESGTSEQKEAAKNYLAAEKKMFEFYNFAEEA